MANRVRHRDQIRDRARRYGRRWAWWGKHPHWAHWRLTRPYRWATYAAIAAWFPWRWSQPVYYNYGENVYYQGDTVYYGDQAVATADEYAAQAQQIVASAPEIDESKAEWMSLGVFALTQDSDASTVDDPTIYMQLVISKEGVINGTLYNQTSETTQEIEGRVDQKTQRAAWVVKGKTSPIVETGIANLTKDEAPALLHFDDGQTQQWLMVRLEEPKDTGQSK